jgi:hypothetical protein
MRDLGAELKSLRLYGMASAWADLVAQGGGASLGCLPLAGRASPASGKR